MIADELNKLKQTKAQIKQALIDKGQNPTDEFASYVGNIGAIATSSSANNAEVHYASELGNATGEEYSALYSPDCEHPIFCIDKENFSISKLNWNFPKAKRIINFPYIIKNGTTYGGQTTDTITYTVPEVEEISGIMVNNSWGVIIDCTDKLKNIDYMLYTYRGCRDLQITDTSNIVSANYGICAVRSNLEISLPSLENADYMFYNSNSVTGNFDYTINDISKPFSANYMFYLGRQIQNIYSNTIWKVTNCTQMFASCSNLLSIPEIDFENCTEARYIFSGCTKLTEFKIKNTHNITDMSSMFSGTGIMNIPDNLDISNATKLDSLFSYCTSLTYIPKLDISKASIADFINNSGVIKIEELEVNEDMISSSYQPFKIGSCSTLRYALLKGLGIRGINKFVSSSYIKADFKNLTNWGIEDENEPLSIGARQSVIDTLLTYSFDRASAGNYYAYTFQLSANTKALLTEEEIAQITAKGYTIA